MQSILDSYAKKLLAMMPKAKHLEERVDQLEKGRYDDMLKELMEADEDELKRRYVMEREMEPDMAGDDWEPEDKQYL